eukprot:c14540_g1_i1.p1 GENE.c14540_g1_i1~~c14540_g1_i1.p1  ORF type:complete len:318 (-),score=79.93 c14540_g1_i1:93-1019(-)
MSVEGKKIAITGTLSMKRAELKDLIEAAGGKVMAKVSKNTDIVVVGEDAGEKLTQAEDLGLTIWTEDEIVASLTSKKSKAKESKPEPKAAAKGKAKAAPAKAAEPKKSTRGKAAAKEAPDDSEIAGKKFVLTGTLSRKRAEIKALIEAAGGKVLSAVSKNVDIIIAGEDGGEKLDKANDLGLTVWDESEIMAALEDSSPPASPVKPKSPAKSPAKPKATSKTRASPSKKKAVSKSVDGKKIVLTGTLSMKRAEAKALITEAGGQVMSAVSKSTDIVVAASGSGDKLDKAHQYGTAIWSEDDLKEALGL